MKREGTGEEAQDMSDVERARPAAPKMEYIAEHTLRADESLSHLALKYYGSAVREKWMIIYEANKEAIGPDPARVRPGTVIKIPKPSQG